MQECLFDGRGTDLASRDKERTTFIKTAEISRRKPLAGVYFFQTSFVIQITSHQIGSENLNLSVGATRQGRIVFSHNAQGDLRQVFAHVSVTRTAVTRPSC